MRSASPRRTAEDGTLFTDKETVIAAGAELTRTARLSEAMIDRLKRFFDDRGSSSSS